MTPRPFDAYLHDKMTAHVSAILGAYMENPDDVELATEDIMEAIENEMIWANGGNRTP